MAERFRLRMADGSKLELPARTYPAGDLGVRYDLQPVAGALGDTWHLEGTGQALPGATQLIIPINADTEAAAHGLRDQITLAAVGAVALERDGQPDQGLMALQASTWQAPDPGDSSKLTLTLTLLTQPPGALSNDGSGGTYQGAPVGAAALLSAILASQQAAADANRTASAAVSIAQTAASAMLEAGEYGSLPSVHTVAQLTPGAEGELRVVRSEYAVYRYSGGAWSLHLQLQRPLGQRGGYQPLGTELTPTFMRPNGLYSTWIFDDATSGTWDWVKPLFDARGIKGNIPAIGKHIAGGDGYMPAWQLRQMQSEGWEIMNHSQNHVYTANLALEADAEYEISEGKRVLEANGLRVPNFVAPYQSQGARERRLIRKYHRSAWISDQRLLTQPLDTFQASRVDFDGNTYAYCVAKVDEAFAAGKAIAWCLHPRYPEYNDPATAATRRQELANLLDYIASKGFVTVTVDQLLDRIGNVLDLGDSTGAHLRIGGDGSMAGTGVGRLVLGPLNGVTAATPATSFAPGYITVHKIQTSQAAGFPTGVGGTLTTDRLISGFGFAVQTYTVATSDPAATYQRTQKDDGSWGNWSKPATGFALNPADSLLANVAPGAAPKGITYNAVTTPNAAGTPTGSGGTLITVNPAGIDFAYQEYHNVQTQQVFIRRASGSAAWTAWSELGGGAAPAPTGGLVHDDTKTAMTAPSAFADRSITVTQVSTAQASAGGSGYPEATGGVLITRKTAGSNYGYWRQTYEVYGTNRTYMRNAQGTADAWLGWSLVGGQVVYVDSVAIAIVNAQGTRDVVVNVPGAVVGNGVVLSPAGGMEAGLMWGGWISAAGQVTIRISNPTAAAITPSARPWRFTLVSA